ncbi:MULTISPECIES: sulfurtransferase TusA family protein [Actinomadura]|uniref:Sulfurtransferase TusA family protein n=1 Tax=Actinomadura yumaensis TaxID=111807 RepID=A0ABW2CDE2_9ACTN|nr:sulfurtransferase TusA family protein [Actinomadura sp. J1-007]
MFDASEGARVLPADEAEPVLIDGGDRACVRLLLELRGRLAALDAGTVVHLIASDPAAPLDLAAWCHLTGHAYLGTVPTPDAPGLTRAPTYALRVAAAPRPTEPGSPWRPRT